VRKQRFRSVRNATLLSAGVGWLVSAPSKLAAFAKGEKSARRATLDTLRDTGRCAGTGATTSTTAVGLEAAAPSVGPGSSRAVASQPWSLRWPWTW
jgi:hypothetical protein